MGGALLGAALASFPGMAWADDCRRLGRECRRDSQCCSGNCVRRGDDKVCSCPEGQSRCGDRCVNLKTNERHCGSCSERCGTNQTCCNGNCVNLQKNENHCGRCFNRCAEGQECVGGVCQLAGCFPTCAPSVPCAEAPGGGRKCCSPEDLCGNKCCSSYFGPLACCEGGCCPEGEACVNGQCGCGSGPSCPAGTTCVSGSCCPNRRWCPQGFSSTPTRDAVCCPEGTECTGFCSSAQGICQAQCCPLERVCGNLRDQCCPEGTQCDSTGVACV